MFDERIWRPFSKPKKNLQLTKEQQEKLDEEEEDDESRIPTKFGLPKHCTIFLGCTSNLFCTVVRDTICAMAKDKLFDVLVVSGGAFEIDIQRALDPSSVVVVENAFDSSFEQLAIFRARYLF
jgi:deoxyhypusine synthase